MGITLILMFSSILTSAIFLIFYIDKRKRIYDILTLVFSLFPVLIVFLNSDTPLQMMWANY